MAHGTVAAPRNLDQYLFIHGTGVRECCMRPERSDRGTLLIMRSALVRHSAASTPIGSAAWGADRTVN